jgi:hypothetical protein
VRLPNSAHEAHRWVIAEIAPDFRLLDAWALPVQGGRDDFASVVDTMTSLDPARASSTANRALFALRFRMGRCSAGTTPRPSAPSPAAPKPR